MAITKILARHARLDLGVKYILNGDKTEEQILTAHLNCDPGRECREMLDTKRAYGKTDGVQYYHVIHSFKPGEVTPELALEIAKEFAQEHLSEYQTVIAVHVDRQHMDIQGANLFFQLIARRYEKTSTVFTSNKTFSQWNEVFADVIIASAILDRVLHHCTVINIKGESYRLKERKEFMRQKQQIVNTLFQQGSI